MCIISTPRSWAKVRPVMCDAQVASWNRAGHRLETQVFRETEIQMRQVPPRHLFWLVVWLPFLAFSHILGMSSSQLTFIFFRGVAQPPTSLLIIHWFGHLIYSWFWRPVSGIVKGTAESICVLSMRKRKMQRPMARHVSILLFRFGWLTKGCKGHPLFK